MSEDRFRFRAWSPHEKKMYYDIQEIYDPGTGSRFSGIHADSFGGVLTLAVDPWDEEARLVVMQCTGLKDQNDRLIYEGDILRINCGLLVPTYYAHVVTWEIEVKDEDDCHRRSGFTIPEYRVERLQVVGNIHQHPELLSNCEMIKDSNPPSEAPPCPAVERSTPNAGKDKD